jgi:hypothetical protein
MTNMNHTHLTQINMYILVPMVNNIMSLLIFCQGATGIRNHIILLAKGDNFLTQGNCTLFFAQGDIPFLGQNNSL